MRVMARIIVALVLGFLGWQASEFLEEAGVSLDYWREVRWGLATLGLVVGLIAGTWLIRGFWRWLASEVRSIPSHSLVAAIIGLIVSLIVSALVALPLSIIPGELGRYLPITVAIVICALGVTIMVQREQDVLQVLHSYVPSIGRTGESDSYDQILLDTSTIIDGRVADLSQTGFLHATLVIPRFILDELRHIADSPDDLRRNRGRRGLDMLNKLQKGSEVPLQIIEADVADVREVDAKLVKLARTMRVPIMTNDFNLNRVAEIQGVRVLNINELANALKPVVLPGEEMQVRVIQEGKEFGQGVAYLDDGTMIVIEGGRRYIGDEVDVAVTRVLQTAAGRMIFARLKVSATAEEGRPARGRSSA